MKKKNSSLKLGLRPGSHTRHYYKNRFHQFLSKPHCASSFQPIPVHKKPRYEDENDWVIMEKPKEISIASNTLGSISLKSANIDSVTFSVNGISHTVTSTDVSAHTMLAEFLRYSLGLTGTKVGCGEGGCGACTVTITRSNNDGGTTSVVANACLRPVLSLDGASVTTTEGIGSSAHGFHPIQKQLAADDGSQCGYCSPGMVMSMYGLLAQTEKPSPKQIEEQFQGNICRCTGYRSILKAMHNVGNKLNEETKVVCTSINNIACRDDIKDATERKHDEQFSASRFMSNDVIWFNPTNLTDVYMLLNEHSSQSIQLTVGNTAHAVAKYYVPHAGDNPEVFINIAQIPRLIQTTTASDGVTFGAAVTLSEVLNQLQSLGTSRSDKKLITLSSHLRKVAHPQVRDVACWAGNIMLAKNHTNFASDVATIFIAAGAIVTVSSASDTKRMNLEEFLSYDMPNNMLLYNIKIPFAQANEIFDTFKVMGRHANSHALVNAGFSFIMDGTKISSCRIVYGNIIQGPLRCTKSQTALNGQTLDLSLLQSTLPVLTAECKPAPPVTDPNFVVVDPIYRQNLATTLFYKFFLFAMVSVFGPNSIDKRLLSATVDYQRALSIGKQLWPKAPPSEAPVGQAMAKIEAPLQASGEALYTSDLPKSTDTLYSVPVLASKVDVFITSIDASSALSMDGVKAFISSQDIKDVGANNKIGLTGYQIFATASEKISYVGQFIGLILATSFSVARRAVKMVKVTYKTTTKHTLKQSRPQRPQRLQNHALSKNATVQAFPSVNTPGAGAKSGDLVVTGKISTTGQNHFYMETQTSFVVPKEGKVVVHCATQSMTTLRTALAKTLNKNASHITISNTRCGGAFGGKAFKHVPVAAATCVAALKMGVPVLCQLDRNIDMSSLGGRPSATADFTTTFDTSSKKITSLTLTATVATGVDTTHGSANCTSLNSYNIRGAKLQSHALKTACPTNTIMRAPGDFQGAFFMEAVIEATSRGAGVDPLVVQEANLQSGCIPIWNEMKNAINIVQKQANVDSFNDQNRWRKRGLYCTSIQYDIDSLLSGQKAIVSILADGSVSIDHSGIEVGQGINTKIIQAACMELGETAVVQMQLVSTITPKDTNHFSSATPTWSSTTSESCVVATINACKTLNNRLRKYKKTGLNWKQIVAAATNAGANLSAVGEFIIALSGGDYKVLGAAATTVELDVLTGECNILTADIFYDCGISLNPEIDIGQVEGSFVQAAGFCLSEEQIWSDVDSRLITNGTWEYKPPCALDIPIDFNVTFITSTNKAKGAVLGSKASGEPAYLLGIGPFFALKNAIYAARKEQGHSEYFRLDAPATPARAQRAAFINL